MLDPIELQNVQKFTKCTYNEGTNKKELYVSNEIKKYFTTFDGAVTKSNELDIGKKAADVLFEIANLKDEVGDKNKSVLTLDDLSELRKNPIKQAELKNKYKLVTLEVADDYIWAPATYNLAFKNIGYSAIDKNIGDFHQRGNICYFLSVLYSVAKARPDIIKDMIKQNQDGSYTVTFKGSPNNPITITQKEFESEDSMDYPKESDVKLLAMACSRLKARNVVQENTGNVGTDYLFHLINAICKKKNDFNSGGNPAGILELFTGIKSEQYCDEEDMSKFLDKALKHINLGGKVALTGDTYMKWSEASHSYAIKNIFNFRGKIFIELVNPWDTSKVERISKDEFLKKYMACEGILF